MTISAPVRRVRNSNRMLSFPTILSGQTYDRYPTCSNSLAWREHYTDTIYGQQGYAESMTDILIPGYHKRVKAGEVFFNPMSHRRIVIGEGTGTWLGGLTATFTNCSTTQVYKPQWKYFMRSGNAGSRSSGYNFSGFNANGEVNHIVSAIPETIVDNLIAEVSTKCQNERGRGGTNLFESFAEGEQLFRLLPGLLRDLHNVLRSNMVKIILDPVRYRGRSVRIYDPHYNGAVARAKGAASIYLAFRYGVTPLVKDIEAVIDGALKKVGDRVRTASRAQQSVSVNSATSSDVPWFSSLLFRRRDRRVDTVTVRAMSLDESAWDLKGNIGLTTKNLFTTPWELIPYSFVADWFLNIGDLLGALYPSTSLTQLGSCITVLQETHFYYQTQAVGVYPSTRTDMVMSSTGELITHEMHYEYKYRTPSLPLPRLVVKTDFRFQNALRSMDALSLCVQQLKALKAIALAR